MVQLFRPPNEIRKCLLLSQIIKANIETKPRVPLKILYKDYNGYNLK